MTKRLILIIWPFLVIAIVLVALAIESMRILSAGRAYVEGESLWSKAQKQSVAHLIRYAHTRSETDYKNFFNSLAVPLGDRKARIELEKPDFDYAAAYQGFLEGRNHPDDIPRMIMLFRRFRQVPYIDRAVTLWERGDRSIDQLILVADELHQRISSGTFDEKQLQEVLELIHSVDARLTPEEDAFSAALGEATRRTTVLLSIANIGLALILLPIGIVLSRRMLKHMETFEKALQLSEERFNRAVAGSNDGIWDWNMPAGEVYYSLRFNELLGHGDDPIPGTTEALVRRLHPEDKDHALSKLRENIEQASPYDVECRLKHRSGEYRWFRVRGRTTHDKFGKAVSMAGSLTEITDRKAAEAELQSAKERAQVTLQSIGDAVITTDTNGLIDYFNPVAETLTGWRLDQVQGLPLLSFVKFLDEKTRQCTPDPVELIMRDGQTLDMATALLLIRHDGSEIPVDESTAPIRNRSGQITGVVLVFRDVSRERQYAAKLSYQASHDALTGLINRREFENRLCRALESARQMGRHHAVMYLDLDQFKVINDTSGHTAGDELMRQISAILQRRLREGDTLARLGGDEFGVLLENCSPEHATRLSEELRQTVAEFPFAWSDGVFSLSVSIGLVCVEGDLFTLADVLSAADAACYMAKEKGRNRVQLYHRNDLELSIRHGEMQWVGRIQRALEQDRLCLYSQEIAPIQASTPGSGHFELLVSMLDEEGKVVPPMAFIPAAERYNLMSAIDRWVVRKAFAILSKMYLNQQATPGPTCSINISGASLGDERFLDFVIEQYRSFGVVPSMVCFEITETAAIANLAKATHFINELKSIGCRFSLDDFGAGMASFAYLKHLPVDFLKIDGGFVKGMVNDPIDRAMVAAINQIGHVMGKLTIAEFVETQEILSALRDIGVDFAQGYAIARPKEFHYLAEMVQLHPTSSQKSA
jgi:diguanylate cyclase (GGDEF)-like protein/PAS domain S-box-containing protein